MRLLIDASNIRAGGGFTHLYELLTNTQPSDVEAFSEICVVGGSNLLQLNALSFVRLEIIPELDKGFLWSSWWKLLNLGKLAKNYDLVFAPGGVFYVSQVSYISMSQNMLVFQDNERRRFPYFSWDRYRLKILQYLQLRSFEYSVGVIFISKFALNYVSDVFNSSLKSKSKLIHLGINPRFKRLPIVSEGAFRQEGKPIKLLYISTLDVYKHQVCVVKAVKKLIEKGLNVELHLIGNAAKRYLPEVLSEIEGYEQQIKCINGVSYSSIETYYHNADIFIFASSCENMPNILIEAMSAGLPIVCSAMGPMPEFLEDAGIYFQPTDVESIFTALITMINDGDKRTVCAQKAYELSAKYSWVITAQQTWKYLSEVGEKS